MKYETHSLMKMMYMVISEMKRRTDQHRGIAITVPSFSGSTRKEIYFGKYHGVILCQT